MKRDIEIDDEYAAQKAKKKKRAIIIGSVILILLLIFFFGSYSVPYSQMYGGIKVVEEDGIISFDYYMTNSGNITYKGGVSKTVIYDYDEGIRYDYYYTWIDAQRWNVWFNKGVLHGDDAAFTQDGREIHSGTIDDNDTSYTREDYIANPGLMHMRTLRIYYANPDGTYILLWEHPDAKEIEERNGNVPEEPGYYRLR